MTELVVSVAPLGVAREVAVGVERGPRYELIGPDGSRAVFGDRDDVDFVGWLSELPSGLDSPEVRESADLLVEADGGIHGRFTFGRRPWTMTGIIDPTPYPDRDVVSLQAGSRLMYPGEVSNRRINRLQRASRGMAADSILRWQAANGPAVQVTARRQQPLRIGLRDNVAKTFMVAMVSANPRIFRQNLSSVAGSVVLATDTSTSVLGASDGNTDTPPVVTIRSSAAITGPLRVLNRATGEAVELLMDLVANDVVVLDFDAHTVTRNGNNAYDAVNFVGSDWWLIQPGDNPVIVTAAGGATGGGGGGSTTTVTPIDSSTSIDSGSIIDTGGIQTTTAGGGSFGNATFEVVWRDAWI